MSRTAAALGILFLLSTAACRKAEPPPPPSPELPPAAPVGINEIAALRASGSRVWLGTSAGVVAFLPQSGSWTLLAADGTVSHEGVRDLALGADGTAWTAHAAEPEDPDSPAAPDAPAAPPQAGGSAPARPRRGGVRAFRPDGSVTAFFAEQGLPSDDVASIAVTDGLVAAATSAGLALLPSGAARFEPPDPSPKRRLTVIDPGAGGTSRNLTEFRPRDERITALLGAGSRLWLGTNHGLLALQDGAWTRVRLPACRRDGRAPDVVTALGARPDGVVAALGLQEGDAVIPSGVAEILAQGTAQACHVPGVDVPEALTPGVASDGRTTWLATYEGLVRVRGSEVILFERGDVLPDLPPTAVDVDGTGGAWVGLWGAGVAHVTDTDVTTWKLGTGAGGIAAAQRRVLR